LKVLLGSSSFLSSGILDAPNQGSARARQKNRTITHVMPAAVAEKRRVTRNTPIAHFCEHCFFVFFSYFVFGKNFSANRTSSGPAAFKDSKFQSSNH
jgi:hypothetical protein